MFENYKQMMADEKAAVKAIHRALRAETSSRSGNLAWAFVRGLPYRRVERTCGEHHQPSAAHVTAAIGQHVPGFAQVTPGRAWATVPSPEVQAWLADPAGAIAAPVREKKPYVRSEVA